MKNSEVETERRKCPGHFRSAKSAYFVTNKWSWVIQMLPYSTIRWSKMSDFHSRKQRCQAHEVYSESGAKNQNSFIAIFQLK